MTNIEAMDSNDVGQNGSSGPSNSSKLDHTPVKLASPARITARALNDVLAFREIGELRVHHLAVAMAVIELNQDAGVPAIWTHDDPTVALLRVAARLSLTHPDAVSSAAAELAASLGRS